MKKIILINIFILISNSLYSQDISGTWNWQSQNEKHISEITLIQNGTDTYSGYYCSSFYNGKKIDCSNSTTEICITIEKTSLNVFTGSFNSPSFNGVGHIELIYEPSQNKLKLKILNTVGEYYLPANVFYK